MMGVRCKQDVLGLFLMSIPLTVVWRVTVCSWTERETRSDSIPILYWEMVEEDPKGRGVGVGGLLGDQKQLSNLGEGVAPLNSPCQPLLQ